MTTAIAQLLILAGILLAGCAPVATGIEAILADVPSPTVITSPQAPRLLVTPTVAGPATSPTSEPTPQFTESPPSEPTLAPPATAAEVMSATPTPTAVPTTPPTTPLPTPTPTLWPTVTRQVLPPEIAGGLLPCSQRAVPDELLLLVTQQFALPESYAPTDLVPLDDYFGDSVTVGIENQRCV